MNWFEHLTGFRETDYATTRSQLEVNGDQLRSRVNGKCYGIGSLELVSLGELRQRVSSHAHQPAQLQVRVVEGDVRGLHQNTEYAGALFQVASQFNLLEMVGPDITPEHGVTRYAYDPTQGPACAIAAGAATIYRNYFAPLGPTQSTQGQTQKHQLDGLADLGAALGQSLGQPVKNFWKMRNGYALCRQEGLEAISAHLALATPDALDALRCHLRIGLHSDIEVTDEKYHSSPPSLPRPLVSQAFCSALPVAYNSRVPLKAWTALACLVLQAAYEATLWAGVLNQQRGKSNIVLLTSLGGGAFGNADEWIHAAMRRALEQVVGYDLDVRLVSYGEPSSELKQIVQAFQSTT